MLLLGASLLVATLGGCGRRGGLEAPLDASAQPVTSAGEAAVSPVVRRSKKTLITPPKESFVLDPLL